jgi:hypothetical protein
MSEASAKNRCSAFRVDFARNVFTCDRCHKCTDHVVFDPEKDVQLCSRCERDDCFDPCVVPDCEFEPYVDRRGLYRRSFSPELVECDHKEEYHEKKTHCFASVCCQKIPVGERVITITDNHSDLFGFSGKYSCTNYVRNDGGVNKLIIESDYCEDHRCTYSDEKGVCVNERVPGMLVCPDHGGSEMVQKNFKQIQDGLVCFVSGLHERLGSDSPMQFIDMNVRNQILDMFFEEWCV